ncbi:MAG: SDR family oxidoreductase [Verrucomicrobiota bacterium]|jgi:dTDP-4-dehydrorhamnose reductase
MRVAITGASGFLGLTLALTAKQRGHQVTAFYWHHPVCIPGVHSVRLDLEDQRAVNESLQQSRPDWIVHCAAATNVDWCEEHPEQARILHVDVSRQLAAAVCRLGANLLYVSTDSVFDGERGGYVENDLCAPVNVYAASKLAGETAVEQALPAALIVRTNMFGWKQAGNPSLVEWIVRDLTDQKPVLGFSDVIFTPLLVNDLSELMLEMMQRRLKGIYHVASVSACSKYDFARLVARAFGLREDLVRPTVVSQAALRAPRARNTALSTGKVTAALGRPMPDVPEAVQRMRGLWDSGFPAQLRQLRGESSYAKV